MAQKNSLFTGAGISFPLGLLTTNGFVDTIRKNEPVILRMIHAYLSKSNTQNDVKKVLYLLEDFTRKDDFTNHVL